MSKWMLLLDEKPNDCRRCPFVSHDGRDYYCWRHGGEPIQAGMPCPLIEVIGYFTPDMKTVTIDEEYIAEFIEKEKAELVAILDQLEGKGEKNESNTGDGYAGNVRGLLDVF